MAKKSKRNSSGQIVTGSFATQKAVEANARTLGYSTKIVPLPNGRFGLKRV